MPLITILLFCDICFAFVPDPNVKLYADKLDRKYFPIFLKTLHMISLRQFHDLEIFFSKELFSGFSSRSKNNYVEKYANHSEAYLKFQTSSNKDMDYEITFPIDWSTNPTNNRSWLFSFHNLSWLNDYLKKGERGDNASSLFAFKVIYDWITSNAQWPPKFGEFAFGDHSTAERLKVFYRAMRLYQKTQYEDEDFFKLLLTGILSHIALIASKEKYLNWHNHGIVFDLTLLEVMSTFKEFSFRDEALELAEKRIVEQFRYGFTPEAIHKEHSPCYHYFVTKMLIQTNDLIQKAGRPVPPVLRILESKTAVFYTYIMKPDGTFPNIGDCAGGRKYKLPGGINNRYYKKHPELIYSLSRGSNGKRPSETAKVFPDSGWAIFRDKWPSDVYAAIQSDFHSWGHYQEDDTSFILNAFGHDFIIDAGIHTYNRDALDIYMRKSRAHNVLIVDDTDFNFNLSNTGLSGITRFVTNNDSTQRWRGAVELTHPHYNHLGVKIYRQFGQIGDTSFVIKDVIESDKPHKYTQLYHLASGAKIEPKTAGTFKISWQTHPYVLWLRSNFDSYDIIEGSMNPVQGWYFPKFGVSVSQPVLRLNKRGESIQFLTFIGIGHGDQEPAWDGMILGSDKMSHAIESLPRQMLKKQPVPERWVPSRKRLSRKKEPQQFQDEQSKYFKIGLSPLNMDSA